MLDLVARRIARTALVSGLALSSALALAPSPASAQVAAPTVAAVREALRTYDPAGEHTLEALRSLHTIIRAGSPADPSVREARFLRAALASDLLIVGALDASRAPAPEHIASTLRVPRDELVGHLRDELRSVGRGPFRVAADEAVAALDAMSNEQGASATSSSGASPRRDALRALAAAEAVEMSAGDPVAALAALAEDPCARGCAREYAWLDEPSRRAARALTLAEEALARLEGPSRDDPFVHAISGTLAEASTTLSRVELAPPPRVPETLASAGDAEHGELLRPDVVVSVGASAVSIAWVPTVRVAERQLVSSAPGAGLDAPESVALPSELRPIVGSIDVVSAAGARLAGI